MMTRMLGVPMLPIVNNNDVCRFEPVENSDTIKEGDIVFCEIHQVHYNLEGKFAFQKVLKVYEEMNIRYYDIGYRDGYRNGWCQGQDIYGRLVEVLIGE